MKKIIFLIVASLLLSCGTSYEMVNHEIPSKERVIELDGSKDELYVRANKWMIENFNNAKSVIQFSDKEAGVVAGKYLLGTLKSAGTGLASGYVSPSQDVFTIITIDVKDDAAKIALTPESFQTVKSSTLRNYGLNGESANLQLEALLASFENYMVNETSAF